MQCKAKPTNAFSSFQQDSFCLIRHVVLSVPSSVSLARFHKLPCSSLQNIITIHCSSGYSYWLFLSPEHIFLLLINSTRACFSEWTCHISQFWHLHFHFFAMTYSLFSANSSLQLYNIYKKWRGLFAYAVQHPNILAC